MWIFTGAETLGPGDVIIDPARFVINFYDRNFSSFAAVPENRHYYLNSSGSKNDMGNVSESFFMKNPGEVRGGALTADAPGTFPGNSARKRAGRSP